MRLAFSFSTGGSSVIKFGSENQALCLVSLAEAQVPNLPTGKTKSMVSTVTTKTADS